MAPGCSERDVQLEPSGSAKRWLEMTRQRRMFFFSLRYLSMEAALCCEREQLVERSQKVQFRTRFMTRRGGARL
ncbi:MAG: hypothetical protein GX244_01150 [Firmicutes bacterium]|nr:hypothetical protein [Bacillota bacterium]